MSVRYSAAAEGVITVTMPFGEYVERKTATCAHCQAITYVDAVGDGTGPLERGGNPPAVCHKCWALVCPRCHAKGTCTPWERQMETIERRADVSLKRLGIASL